jgi:elongation factor Tu
LPTTDVTGTVELGEMVMPGDNAELTVELHKPIAMEEKSHLPFARETRLLGPGRGGRKRS